MDGENDEGDGLGAISFICSSLSCIILSIFVIFSAYMYYKRMRNIESGEPIYEEKSRRTYQQTPRQILSTADGAIFNMSTTDHLLIKQDIDKCDSSINNGICNNSLIKGDSIFNITTDGNLVLKKGKDILWQSFTNKIRDNPKYSLVLTNEGILKLSTNNNEEIWSSSNTEIEKKSPYQLILREDNNLVIENNQKNVVWQTDTARGKESPAVIARSNTGLAGPSDTSSYLSYTDIVSNLPSSFRLDSLPPTDQYDVATCVTSQILGIFTYYYWKLFNKEYWFSRLFTWHYDQLDSGGNPSENNGSSASSVYNTIRKRGLLLEKYYTYDGTIEQGSSGIKNTCSTPKYKETPQAELSDIAKKNIPQFTVYSISITPNLDQIKSAIFNGMPVLCGISTYASYNSTSTNTSGVITYPDKTKEKQNPGGHQVSLWGWDDSQRVFHLLNTRGSNYMNKGWCTIPYEYILDPKLSYDFECFKLNQPVLDIVDDNNYVNMDDWVFKKDLGCVYVNTVQKGVQCFERPPKGYDWTTDGGVLIGKTCPEGSKDSGVTCWYDRGVGRIPDKRACADGERDTPTECWLDSYGVGAGRGADYGDCPPRSHPGAAGDCYGDQTDRQRQSYDNGRFPNEGEPWGKSWDKKSGPDAGCSWDRHMEGGMCFRDCPDGFFGRAHEKCWANGADSFGVMKRSADRLKCNDNEDKDGLMCYPKCRAGYHKVGCCICEPDNGGPRVTKWLHDRQYCADDEEMKDGLCYKKCKEGFNTGVTICEFPKDVKSGKFRKDITHCK